MPSNAVVVVDDNAASCNEIVEWLQANDVAAYAASNASVMALVEQVQARVVICRPGSTGIALFHALQESADPPMVVLLSDAAQARDEIYCNGRMLVALVRTPVQLASLARFIKAMLGVTARLDAAALAALAAATAPAFAPADDAGGAPTEGGPTRLRLVH